MKKLISLVLALVMVMGMATTAFAAEVTSPTTLTDEANSVDIPVTGEYIEELKSDEIISVDVAWDAMDFTYAATQQGTWNPGSHTYDNPVSTAAWVNDTTSDIKVTNHSNVDVTATFAFVAEDSYSTVTGSFKAGESDTAAASKSVDLDAGVVNDYANADNETVTFEIGGTLAKDTAEGTKLGTITVSVNKKATSSKPEAVTYTLRTKADEIWYWNQGGTQEKGDPDWNKVYFVVEGSDGYYKELAYSDVLVTSDFVGEMDLSMKPYDEGYIQREYSFTAIAFASQAGIYKDVHCTFKVTVCNSNIFMPSTAMEIVFL